MSIRGADGTWQRLSVTRPDGQKEDVYLARDKSRADLRCELDTRTLGRIFAEVAPDAEFETVRRDRAVYWKRNLLAQVIYDRAAEATKIVFEEAPMEQAGIDKEPVLRRFNEASEALRAQRG